MEKRYSLEKAMEEAGRIGNITGKGGTSDDIRTAAQIITEVKREMLLKLRTELDLLIGDSILVIDMEKSPTELADILVDTVPPKDADAVRDYLKSEKSIEIVREEQDSQNRFKFYIKIR